jgi:hypothetical protein
MPRLLAEMEKWSTETPYIQRAAAAGLCEPRMLKEPEHVTRVLSILDRITKSFAATSARKRGEDFRVLKQALGYCWSVAAAALPEAGRPLMEKWLRSPDKDVAWVMQSNLAKARIGALGASWVTKWRGKGPAPAPPQSIRSEEAPTRKSAPKAAAKPGKKPPKKGK